MASAFLYMQFWPEKNWPSSFFLVRADGQPRQTLYAFRSMGTYFLGAKDPLAVAYFRGNNQTQTKLSYPLTRRAVRELEMDLSETALRVRPAVFLVRLTTL